MSQYAHSKPECPPDQWQPLVDHLQGVGSRAAAFAGAFGAEEWGDTAGLLHDIGKYSEAFQAYLRTVSDSDAHVAESAGRVDHSTAGAKEAVNRFEVLGHLLAYPLAGHHSGLLDGIGANGCQQRRLIKAIEYVDGACIPETVAKLPVPKRLADAFSAKPMDAFAVAFYCRMLYSCLVDADFLDTERFMDASRSMQRPSWPADIMARMAHALDRKAASFGEPRGVVNQQRVIVRSDCLSAAEKRPGLFSLTVPTGGGKTFASLAFALKHAHLHGLSRVIYVAPFTSIIEQNAEVFREAMREVSVACGDVVVEHHSSFDAEHETVRTRLATENWDAPLVVTTSVQFYESMFANRSRRCRKLHNLAKAVIVLDEVQTLPVDFLQPCLKALRELVDGYGSSVVLCTATQPAVEFRSDFGIGLKNVQPIVQDSAAIYRKLRRVTVTGLGPTADGDLVQRLLAEAQVLCIVNTRGHAAKLHRELGEDDGHVHLSASMCPAHRSRVLADVRERLAGGMPCRVVSTQLIEAGVDISFPVVFRALAGADAIAQAAGRCNRNGEILAGGTTYVFESEHAASERYLAETAGCTKQILALYPDLISLEAIEHYFRLYYWSQNQRWDAKKICDAFHLDGGSKAFPFLFSFATAAAAFRLIDSDQRPVIVPWDDEARELCQRVRGTAVPGWAVIRKLQRYTVQVRRRLWEAHINRTIEHVHGQFPILMSCDMNYSPRTGLDLDGCGNLLDV